MSISLSISTVSKLAGLVLALTKECPLKKISKNELNAAIDDLEHLNSYSNIREGLNSALVHLESAYHNFEPSQNFILVWMENNDKIYWDQRTYQNDLRIMMAVLHYALGNIDITRKWLEELTDCGWIHIPNEALDFLGFASPNDFFRKVFNTNEDIYATLQWRTKVNNENAIGLHDPAPSSFDYLP